VGYPPAVDVSPLNGFPAEADDKPTVPKRNATTRIDRIRIAFIFYISSIFKYEYCLLKALIDIFCFHLLIIYIHEKSPAMFSGMNKTNITDF